MVKIKISVVIPAYNEEDAIEDTIRKIIEVMKENYYEYEIIVINDGSTDNSLKILENIKSIKLINHGYNKGYGASLREGIESSKYDFILITDADSTYPIEDIPKFIEYLDNFDMVVGARTNTKNVSLSKKIAKFIITKLSNHLTKRKIPDINSGFRIFRRDLAMKFFHLFPDGFSFTTTITLAFLTNNYSVKYIPIQYFKRKGKSKIKSFDFFVFLELILRMMIYFKPLRIFSLIGFLLFLIGIVIFLYSLIFLDKVLDVTVTIILLTSLQIFILGLIADLIIKRSAR